MAQQSIAVTRLLPLFRGCLSADVPFWGNASGVSCCRQTLKVPYLISYPTLETLHVDNIRSTNGVQRLGASLDVSSQFGVLFGLVVVGNAKARHRRHFRRKKLQDDGMFTRKCFFFSLPLSLCCPVGLGTLCTASPRVKISTLRGYRRAFMPLALTRQCKEYTFLSS